MQTTIKSLIWASIIIAVAYATKDQGMSDAASFGVTMGLVGAALANIGAGKCRGLRSC